MARDCPDPRCNWCGTAGHREMQCEVKKFQENNSGKAGKQCGGHAGLAHVDNYNGRPAHSMIFGEDDGYSAVFNG